MSKGHFNLRERLQFSSSLHECWHQFLCKKSHINLYTYNVHIKQRTGKDSFNFLLNQPKKLSLIDPFIIGALATTKSNWLADNNAAMCLANWGLQDRHTQPKWIVEDFFPRTASDLLSSVRPDEKCQKHPEASTNICSELCASCRGQLWRAEKRSDGKLSMVC